MRECTGKDTACFLEDVAFHGKEEEIMAKEKENKTLPVMSEDQGG